jgi:uncharacterized membrane protein
MSKTLTRSVSQNKMMSTKLVMGLMVAAVSVLVGTSNIASAMPGGGHGHGNASGHHQNGHSNGHGAVGLGHGYGGGNVSVNIGDIVGNNNVIVIIINYFVGH